MRFHTSSYPSNNFNIIKKYVLFAFPLAFVSSTCPSVDVSLLNLVPVYVGQAASEKPVSEPPSRYSYHISYAIERYEQGINLKNALLWEIKRFYPHEYDIGVEGVKLINEELKINLPEDEAGYIAIHIVNTELNMDIDKTMEMTEIMQDVLDIIKYFFQVTFDEKQLAYTRLTTHLKYFVQRVSQGEYSEEIDLDFTNFIANKYPDAYDCASRVSNYTEAKIGHLLSEEEKIYLTVHIHRVIENLK